MGHIKVWKSITPTGGATTERVSTKRQLEGAKQSMGVHHPNLRGHTKMWESITPTRGASQDMGVHHANLSGHTKRWVYHSNSRGQTSHYGILHFGGPPLVGVMDSHAFVCPLDLGYVLRPFGNTEPWESTTPTGWARPKLRSPSPKVEAPHQSVGAITPTQGATSKRESPSPQITWPHHSMVVHHPNSGGQTEVWDSTTPIPGATPRPGSPSHQL